MGSGLIPQVECGMESPEDIGERYLAQLTRKSFFSFVPTGDPHSKYCKGYYIMHDLLHDLARSVSFGECLRLDESGDHVHHRHTVRHLWVAGLSKFTVDEIEAISLFKNAHTCHRKLKWSRDSKCICTGESCKEVEGLAVIDLKRGSQVLLLQKKLLISTFVMCPSLGCRKYKDSLNSIICKYLLQIGVLTYGQRNWRRLETFLV
jgi:hypothetical protein